jgi:hypothetical protein
LVEGLGLPEWQDRLHASIVTELRQQKIGIICFAYHI